MKTYAGLDIGGTKCAVILANVDSEKIKFISRTEFKTVGEYTEVLEKLSEVLQCDIEKHKQEMTSSLESIGISCGGPLDSQRGIIMSPPNLPGWDNVEIVEYFEKKFNVKCKLLNDADACAVAEWKYGAGVGENNMMFLTFGTGLGAGLILNGQLYTGTTNTAGEIGHIRIAKDGPLGYGKRGSFEGYCSGGGITRFAEEYFANKTDEHSKIMLKGIKNKEIATKQLAELAKDGDKDCIEIFNEVGEKLGSGLAILIDILNPSKIIIGGVFMRSGELMINAMQTAIEREALTINAQCVSVVKSQLDEKIGDYGAIVAGLM